MAYVANINETLKEMNNLFKESMSNIKVYFNEKNSTIKSEEYYFNEINKAKIIELGKDINPNTPEEIKGIKIIDSVTIKGDPNNEGHRGKDFETFFKEGEEEDEMNKRNELGIPIYYFSKLKGGVLTKPEDLQYFQANGKSK